jgi:sterol O-acyltransferase
MIMKCHSYMAVNGYLQWVHKMHRRTTKVLDREVGKRGGWDKVLQEAAAAGMSPENSEEMTSDSSGGNTPEIAPDGTVTSYIDPPVAQALRQRIIASQNNNDDIEITQTNGNGKTMEDKLSPHPLITHPDPQLSSIAQNLTDMSLELTSQLHNNNPKRKRKRITWPENVTFANFADYQLIPTLVYELEYPRTERIRPVYVLEKTIATFGSFALLYTVTAHFILPLVPTPEEKQSFWISLLDLSIPFMVAYLLLFFIIFGELLSSNSTDVLKCLRMHL